MSWLVEHAGQGLLALHIAVLITIKAVIPLGHNGLATITDPLAGIDTAAVVLATNGAREAAFLPPLERSAVLDEAARRKLDDMAQRQYFAHQSPIGVQPWDWITGVGYTYRSAGENLARGFSEAQPVVDAWMQSPSHRANLLNPAYRHIGVAARRVMLNGSSQVVMVQLFAAPMGAPLAKAPVPAASPKLVPTPVAPSPSAPQAVSTEPSIVPVRVPVSVTVPVGHTTAAIARTMASGFAVYLTVLLALIALSAAWLGASRKQVWALAANAVVMALLALTPLLPAGTGLIF